MAKIVNVEIWNEKEVTKNNVGKTIIGGALFGVVGAIVGNSMGKHKNYTTFKVTYENGKIEFLEFKNGSFGYNNLIKFMQDQERTRK